MNKFNASLVAAMVAGGLFTVVAHAAVDPKAYGATYQPVASVTPSQAQVVFYRTAQASGSAATHVYLDGEFQSALLTGMFTNFCVAAGSHSLAGFSNDAPYYQGKEQQPYRATFEGGKTYYVKVDPETNGRPLAVSAAQAAIELKGLKAQAYTLNRAATAEACRYTASQHLDFTLSSDVLFNFGKASRNDISAQGRQAISELIGKLRKDGVELNLIQIIGHTDPIGKEATNLRLGQQRANTVRNLLIEGGLPAKNLNASSAGSSEMLTEVCRGTRAEQIACNAPNRRVVVRVQTQ